MEILSVVQEILGYTFLGLVSLLILSLLIIIIVSAIDEHKFNKAVEELRKSTLEPKWQLDEPEPTEEEIDQMKAAWEHYCFKEENWNDPDFIEEALKK